MEVLFNEVLRVHVIVGHIRTSELDVMSRPFHVHSQESTFCCLMDFLLSMDPATFGVLRFDPDCHSSRFAFHSWFVMPVTFQFYSV